MAKQFFLFCIGASQYVIIISHEELFEMQYLCVIFQAFLCRWYFEHVWFRLNATVACIWQINVPKMLKDTNWFRNVELTDVFITIDNLTVIFNNNIVTSNLEQACSLSTKCCCYPVGEYNFAKDFATKTQVQALI